MAEPGLEPTPLDTRPLPRLKGVLIVEVPCSGLGILPRAGVLAPLGILRGLAVWARGPGLGPHPPWRLLDADSAHVDGA